MKEILTKIKMKEIILTLSIIVAIAASLTLISCSDDDNGGGASCFDGIRNGDETGIDCGGSCVPCATCDDGIQNGDETGVDCGGSCEPCTGSIDVSGIITTNTTWTKDNIYFLNNKVVVENGVTLTIEAGTIIKGKAGTGSLASALIIARGAKLMAEGTAVEPIIFTSENDNIEVGQTAGTNLDETDSALWGGLLILGKAKGSFKGDVDEVQIEGIPAGDDWGLYGGNDDSDNSGVVKYVSIRFGGAEIGEGNEINGLTLGAVGSGTVIENVEVVGNLDDGIEFFGGTVSPKNLMVWAAGDDGLDIDQSYSGTITNSMVILGTASDHALEIDGPEGSYEAEFTINDLTLKGNTETPKGEFADYRSEAMGSVNNVYAFGFKEGADVELDNNGVSQNFLDGKITFDKWELVGFDNTIFVEKVATDENDNPTEEKIIKDPDFPTRAISWTETVDEGSQTVGADTSVFDWTYSKMKGAF